jgi:hypothetical protein
LAESDRHRIEVGRDYVRLLIHIKCGLVLIRATGNIHVVDGTGDCVAANFRPGIWIASIVILVSATSMTAS